MQDGMQKQMVCQETYGLRATEGNVSLTTKGALLPVKPFIRIFHSFHHKQMKYKRIH